MNELILLNMSTGVGSIRTKALLDRFGSPENILKARLEELTSVAGVGPKTAENILNTVKNRSLLDEELKLARKESVKIITVFDKDYPARLKEIYDPPIVLYVKGEIKKEDDLAVAIVGSRNCSVYGSDSAGRLAEELADFGITVVSGMARGIDTAAHNGALKKKGRTLAVLGSGLSKIYPPENKKLSEAIAESGAVISEFPMTFGPLPENFPRRNRIISGLALGVVVVEAAKDSGALITARYASEQGREVFSVPGHAKLDKAFGTNQLIKDGAKLVEDAKDIIEELSVNIKGVLKEKKARPLPAMNEDEMKIFETLRDAPLYIDDISVNSKFSIAKTSSVLTTLEIKGLVRRLSGGKFQCRNL